MWTVSLQTPDLFIGVKACENQPVFLDELVKEEWCTNGSQILPNIPKVLNESINVCLGL